MRYAVQNIDTGETHEAANAAECEALLERLAAGSPTARWRVRAILPDEGAKARPAEHKEPVGEKEERT